MEPDIQLSEAALHTKGFPHQMDAWRWLQTILTPEELAVFALKFRNRERIERIENQFVAPDAAFTIIKKYEGFRAKPYICPAGAWTIGYGTTKYPNGKAVTAADPNISMDRAEEILKDEVNRTIVPRLQKTVPNWFAMNKNQQAALISFAYNLGAGFMEASSGFETIQRCLRNKEWNKMRDAFILYVKGDGKTLSGLVNRRQEEADLWETPIKV